jgi:ceramide kinase
MVHMNFSCSYHFECCNYVKTSPVCEGDSLVINSSGLDGLLLCDFLFHSNQFDLPFVEVHRAREFTFRALPAPVSRPEFPPPRHIPGVSVWNCDGEVQWETNIRIRLVCGDNTL